MMRARMIAVSLFVLLGLVNVCQAQPWQWRSFRHLDILVDDAGPSGWVTDYVFESLDRHFLVTVGLEGDKQKLSVYADDKKQQRSLHVFWIEGSRTEASETNLVPTRDGKGFYLRSPSSPAYYLFSDLLEHLDGLPPVLVRRLKSITLPPR